MSSLRTQSTNNLHLFYRNHYNEEFDITQYTRNRMGYELLKDAVLYEIEFRRIE